MAKKAAAAKRKAAGNDKGKAGRQPSPDRPVTFRLTATEFQLVSYAASKTRARGVNAFVREAVVEAARHAAGKAMADDILSGTGTVRLLKESLAEARKNR